ncbi:hypothetical protein BDW72DRAFT_190224 [Aspergillus terricola var. indicus]
MTKQNLTRILGYIAIPSIATGFGIHLGLNHLENKYPELPPAAAGSKALSTPAKLTQRCAYTDIYAARIPLRALQARTRHPDTKDRAALEEAWARSLLSCQLLRTEASLIGLFTRGKYEPGDVGENGFGPDSGSEPRVLLNGALTVRRQPGAEGGNGLLVAWEMPDGPRLFFEKIARWGYPWRLMSGGRHEMIVSEPFRMKGQGEMVEVRFSAAHDYEVVEEEGGLRQQKVLPAWAIRLHRGYARLILDMAAREVEKGT